MTTDVLLLAGYRSAVVTSQGHADNWQPVSQHEPALHAALAFYNVAVTGPQHVLACLI